ncbi:MAG TPA: hypothetical protein P5048_04065, partial [Chlamydiales bacterium]|nr:hypothetical protein [Chlamydiales bacterium]
QKSIAQENTLWLVDYYYSQLENDSKSEFFELEPLTEQQIVVAKRLVQLLEKESLPQIKILKDKIDLEEQFVKLATSYAWINQNEKQRKLLEFLKVNYEKYPEENWQYKEKVFYDLAIAYKHLEEKEKSLTLLEQLASSEKKTPISAIASYKMAMMIIEKTKKPDLNSGNVDFLRSLTLLKTLGTQKDIRTEPIHIEAALSYADIQSSFAEDHLKKKKFLLSRVKKYYLSEDDLISKDYHFRKKSLPEKERLFNAYIQLIDLELDLIKLQEKPDPSLSNRIKIKIETYEKGNDAQISLLNMRYAKCKKEFIEIIKGYQNNAKE